jgi:hypothetical protein
MLLESDWPVIGEHPGVLWTLSGITDWLIVVLWVYPLFVRPY